MKKRNKEIWIGPADKSNDPEFLKSINQEFVDQSIAASLARNETMDLGSNRRDFLKYLGFGLGAATLAASCDIPIKRAIPYVTKTDQIVPGVANYYASSFAKGGDYCSILVKTREGRPIKVEGNSLSEVTKGGTNARVQASVLNLYDSNRFKSAGSIAAGSFGEQMAWDVIDREIKSKLTATSKICILSNTLLSPTAKLVIEEFKAKYPNTFRVTYDAVSSSAMLEANEQSFGLKAIPSYHFDKADVIVSFGADFLGTWISPIEYAGDYVKGRKIHDVKHPKMSHHVQVESGMTMTGSNADNRIMVKPSEQGAAIATLYNAIASKTGAQTCNAPAVNEKASLALAALATELLNNKGKSLIVSGSNNIGEQLLVNKINDLLANYGATLDFNSASLQRQGIDGEIQGLIQEMNRGGVAAVFVLDANPAFDLPNAGEFAEAFAKVPLKVSFAGTMDETTSLCDFVTPSNHQFESWGDAEPKRGHYSLIQPTISPLFDTRQTEESLLRWADSPNIDVNGEQPYYEYLKKAWETNMFTHQNGYTSFQSFWDQTLHNGVFTVPKNFEGQLICSVDVNTACSKINKPAGSEFELSFFETINVGAGEYADNPWLQELPDPVTRCVWGNYLTVPISFDGDNDYSYFRGIGENNKKSKADFVNITANGTEQKVTAIPQFGQMPGTFAMGLGYGRKVISQSGKGIGVNVNPWLSIDSNGNTQYYATNIAMSEIVGIDDEFACVQYHNTMGVRGTLEGSDEEINVDERILGYKGYQGSLVDRTVIRQSNIKDMQVFLHGDKEKHIRGLLEEREDAKLLNSKSIYSGYEDMYSQGHHWAMHVDLNACIGCGTCAVACMAENNVPVVGKREVHRHHEMSWMRIDRYFYGDIENPSVVYQPLMCQHCDNAPCENVCPVAATNHSSEGLNQMTYNRCIGTRYCANNCPYKVRRFNWYDYTTADLFAANEIPINGEAVPFGADNLFRMVLNPDVTVRSRGVIEKCSFCVQRIQEGKLVSKKEKRALRDGDVKTACQTSCPTGAIVFGDGNNKNSAVSKAMDSSLNYRVLEEINVDSSVFYSSKINNRSEALDA